MLLDSFQLLPTVLTWVQNGEVCLRVDSYGCVAWNCGGWWWQHLVIVLASIPCEFFICVFILMVRKAHNQKHQIGPADSQPAICEAIHHFLQRIWTKRWGRNTRLWSNATSRRSASLEPSRLEEMQQLVTSSSSLIATWVTCRRFMNCAVLCPWKM